MPGSVASRGIRTGVVEEFDDHRGLGHVLGDDGRRYGFHCTAVADGSRHIDAGARVTYLLSAGHLGRLEARDIVAIGEPPGGERPSDDQAPSPEPSVG